MRDFQCMCLVAAGNAALRGADLGRFWPDAAIFRWTERIEFVVPTGEDQFDVVATDPLQWFEGLKGGCDGLRLHTAPMNPSQRFGHLSERTMAGFVGGGPRWLIEVVDANASVLWEGFDRTGDRMAPDRRIWRTAYIRQNETQRLDAAADTDVSGAINELRAVLAEIQPLAQTLGVAHFAEMFANAHAALDARPDPTRDLGAPLAPAAQRLIAAAMQASVFGGMGSWNDIVPVEAYSADYERLSEALFQALQRAVLTAANSTF